MTNRVGVQRSAAPRRCGVWLSSVLSMAWLAACDSDAADATYTVIVVDAERAIRDDATKLHIHIERDDAPAIDDDPEFKWPQQFVLSPRNNDASRRFTFSAEAFDGDGDSLGSVSLSTGFVAGKTRYGRVLIGNGTCKASRDASELSASAPGEDDEPIACSDSGPTAGHTAVGSAGEAGSDESDGSGGAGGGPDVLDNAYGGSPGKAGRGGVAGKGGAGGKSGAGGKGGDGGAGKGAAGGGGKPEVPACGDGKVADNEKCDTGIAQGEPGACPTECKASKACAIVKMTGAACQTQCEETAIQDVGPKDGCCPPGANAKTDDDCDPKCGNGVVEAGETCDPVDSCPTKASCTSNDVCVPVVFSGDPSKCSAKCELQAKITDCKGGDRCCPDGCSHDTDSDCMATCGDGRVDTSAGETCDPMSSTPCPSCDDNDACTTDTKTGSETTCNVKCGDHVAIKAGAADTCCPSGANNNTDPDCQVKCGNGAREMGEECDGDCPENDAACADSDPCTVDRVTGSECARKCVHNQGAMPSTASKDGCCPIGASATTDADCAAATVNLVKGKRFYTPTPTNMTEMQPFPIGPESITDGNLDSRWISVPESGVMLAVDLGATYTLTRIRIVWAGNTVKNFALAIASDQLASGSVFYAGTTNNQMVDDEEYSTATPRYMSATGRYLLIYCTDRWNSDFGNSIYEVEVYGLAAP